MIQDNIRIELLGDSDAILTGSVTQNNIPVLEENYVQRMNANNGFSRERLFRKIASVPDVAWLKAAQDGYNMDDERDIRRFLSDNPDYMTVERLDSRRSPNIIVR